MDPSWKIYKSTWFRPFSETNIAIQVFVSMVDHHPGSFVQYITKLRQKRWPEDNGTEGAPEKAAVTKVKAKTGPRLRVCSCYIVSL